MVIFGVHLSAPAYECLSTYLSMNLTIFTSHVHILEIHLANLEALNIHMHGLPQGRYLDIAANKNKHNIDIPLLNK